MRYATLSLSLSKPQVVFSDHRISRLADWRLEFDAGLAGNFQSVELTTGAGDLRDLEGKVIFVSTSSEAYMGFEKGMLDYREGSDSVFGPSPQSYIAFLRISDADFGRLKRTVSDGLPLLSASLEVVGMEYGWEPDGRKKKWDNAVKHTVEIKGYVLFFGRPEEQVLVPDPPESAIDTEIKILDAVRDAQASVRYILYALLALAVAVIFR